MQTPQQAQEALQAAKRATADLVHALEVHIGTQRAALHELDQLHDAKSADVARCASQLQEASARHQSAASSLGPPAAHLQVGGYAYSRLALAPRARSWRRSWAARALCTPASDCISMSHVCAAALALPHLVWGGL